ncbi:MAG: MarR family winged helix-turn-helix transcriptional regulator [Polyangiales bacterium]
MPTMVKKRRSPRISYLVKWVERGLRSELDTALSAYGLTTPEYTALSVLHERDGLSSAQLARRTFVTPQAMNQLVISLERRVLVERQPDSEHRRILRTSLTRSGRALVARCDRATRDVEQRLLSGFSRAEAEQLRHALSRCVSALGAGRGR